MEAWRKRKAYGLHLSFVDDLQENIFMNVDATLVRFMLDTLTKEWANRLAEREKEGSLTLRVSEDDDFVRFTLLSSVRIYEAEEAIRYSNRMSSIIPTCCARKSFENMIN